MTVSLILRVNTSVEFACRITLLISEEQPERSNVYVKVGGRESSSLIGTICEANMNE